ncbi:N-acetylglucosamine-6-phosphate deacetylase [Fusarium oxysporum f. sp. phaseoli]
MAIESCIIRFTNCELVSSGQAKRQDLLVDTSTGRIIDETDPRAGLLDVQLNGAKGFNFSDVPTEGDMESYASSYRKTCEGILEMGVTGFLPTLTTSEAHIFHVFELLTVGYSPPYYLELKLFNKPCLTPQKKGAHSPQLFLEPTNAVQSILDFYGADSLGAPSLKQDAGQQIPAIKKLTLAPELPGMLDTIRTLRQEYGIVCSLGHSAATYEQGLAGVSAGANMITHLFNAMEPCLHRSPGLVGLIGAPETDLTDRPFFGLIADDIHVAPSCVRMAWAVHKNDCILTTDGTAATGWDLPEGTYEWMPGKTVVKNGEKLFLEGTDTIAGGSTTLLQCVSNLIRWTGCDVAEALQTVTANPARMLGCEDTKGTLKPGADADLVVLSWSKGEEKSRELQLDEVWKFGKKCFTRKE